MPPQFSCVPLRSTSENCAVLPCFSDFGCFPTAHFLTFPLKGSHTTAHTPKQGPSGRGRYHYPRSVPHVHEHPRAGYQNGILCPFWVLAEGAPEERREPAMRLCASLSRGVAAPLGCVICFRFCRNCGLYALFQILLSVLQTLQLVPFLCKLRLSSFLFGSEFNGFRSKQAGFFAIILENV